MSSIMDAVNVATEAIAILQNPGLIISNVPIVPLISPYQYFLNTLTKWDAAIPLRTQFIAVIHSFPPGLSTGMLQALENTDGSKQDWNIDNAVTNLTKYPFQEIMGCIFLQGASIPTENLGSSSALIDNNRGFIQGSILGNRDAFAGNNLTLQFRETNTSFTDFVMRPWLILAAHNGYVARNPNSPSDMLKNPKVNITIIQYAKTLSHVSMIPRKIWNYYDCVPLNLGIRNLSYDTEAMESYDVSFLYSHYGIQDNSFTPLPNIIQTIAASINVGINIGPVNISASVRI